MKTQILWEDILFINFHGRDCIKEYPGKIFYSKIFRKGFVVTNIQERDGVKKRT